MADVWKLPTTQFAGDGAYLHRQDTTNPTFATGHVVFDKQRNNADRDALYPAVLQPSGAPVRGKTLPPATEFRYWVEDPLGSGNLRAATVGEQSTIDGNRLVTDRVAAMQYLNQSAEVYAASKINMLFDAVFNGAFLASSGGSPRRAEVLTYMQFKNALGEEWKLRRDAIQAAATRPALMAAVAAIDFPAALDGHAGANVTPNSVFSLSST